MGRPRKNRINEYAELLGQEISQQLGTEMARAIAESQRLVRAEIERLRGEIRALEQRVDGLSQGRRTRSARLGRWVPGGPGRPPKDAAERVAAFASRQGETAPTRTGPSKRGPRKAD